MRRLALLALSILVLATVFAKEAMASSEQVLSEKERYALAESLRLGLAGTQDVVAAYQEMQALAQTGNARAQAKLAYYHLKGVGTVPDPDAAIEWYKQAIDGGREGVRTSLGKVLMRQGQTDAALEQLTLASAAGIEKAQVIRAIYHYEGKFGAKSDVEFGRAELTRFAKAGDMTSMQVVLMAMNAGKTFDVDPVRMSEHMISTARNDDGKTGGQAAEGLLRLWRERTDKEALALRAEMVAHAGLRGRIRAEDRLLLAYDTHDARAFRKEAEQIIAQTARSDYARAVLVVSRLDKNAFVHVLQEELRTRGYRVGKTTGIFNTRTLNAVVKFCADTNIQRDCRLGPLRSKVIKVIVGELAAMPPTL
ncbi:hypothetical protein NBRC116594_29400 [Shimia sp. NS0008-38b]|uniref:hypothetical protein n=1 Tax=Shimia sp. NS0008-38b TaxID=3127653 RepID=UPI0031034206